MPYYPSIDQDLKRAEEILEKGKSTDGIEGTIYGTDIYAAYQLLKSFVPHIRHVHQEHDAYQKMITELEAFKRRAIAVNQKAASQIAAAGDVHDRLAALEAQLQRPKRLGPLTETHPALQSDACPACNRSFVAGDYVTFISIGPGDQEEEQRRAAAGKPYTAIAILAHWACVTGETIK